MTDQSAIIMVLRRLFFRLSQSRMVNMIYKDFITEYMAIVTRTVNIAKKVQREGLLALEDEIDHVKLDQRDIFEHGLLLVTDEANREFIDKVLSNIINLEKDEERKILKTIQKEAVLGIQERLDLKLLFFLLSSYVSIEEMEGISEVTIFD
jgi:hypothetical protein